MEISRVRKNLVSEDDGCLLSSCLRKIDTCFNHCPIYPLRGAIFSRYTFNKLLRRSRTASSDLRQHFKCYPSEVPLLMMPSPMFLENWIPVLIITLSHLFLLPPYRVIPLIRPSLTSISSTVAYQRTGVPVACIVFQIAIGLRFPVLQIVFVGARVLTSTIVVVLRATPGLASRLGFGVMGGLRLCAAHDKSSSQSKDTKCVRESSEDADSVLVGVTD